MSEIIRLERVPDYCQRYHFDCLNDLVTLVDFSYVDKVKLELNSFGFYAMILKESYDGPLTYGLSRYNYQNGTMLFVAPDQIFGADSGVCEEPQGYALLFSQNLFRGLNPAIASYIKESPFFSQDCNEALELTPSARAAALSCFTNIMNELKAPFDKQTFKIIVANILTILAHCERCYDRQYSEQRVINNELYTQFREVVEDYYKQGLPEKEGLPSVQYCARRLGLTPNYFGDIIKRISGRSAKEQIQQVTIDHVKALLIDRSLNISEVAYKTGFKYPHHLSRVFKKMTGLSPFEYRRKALREMY
ncbi:MAG: AraC family transcriptional regulator [Muribaculaceae bacterium]|nr:AraC family transcriptional regulator [Muribaculaceae bacterium]